MEIPRGLVVSNLSSRRKVFLDGGEFHSCYTNLPGLSGLKQQQAINLAEKTEEIGI
jgi:hypothetical protein